MAKLRYTVLYYQILEELDISTNEYVILDTIHSLQQNTGWCYLTRENMGKNIGCSKRGVINIVDSLVDRGFIEKSEDGRLRTTEMWKDPKFLGEKSAPDGEKSAPASVKKVHRVGEKSAPNNNIDNNTDKNKDNTNESDIFEIPDFDENETLIAGPHISLHEKPMIVVPDVPVVLSKEQILSWKRLRFVEFWKRYGKKKSKPKVMAKFLSLTIAEIDKVIEVIDDHVLITPDIQFRKHPLTWLNQGCWDDDISVELKRYKPRVYQQTKTNTEDNDW